MLGGYNEVIRPPEEERPIYRFPRADDEITLYIAKLRSDYPAPEHDSRYGTNPADLILTSLGECDRKKLKRLAENHSLEDTGGRRKIIKRIYLHWRAAKFGTGDPQIGYGKGFKSTKTPTCPCGFRRRADVVAFERNKEKQKEMIKKQLQKLNNLWKDPHRRFPRYKLPMRFPRLR